tara:strand:+ start:2809 stop:3723 length:915 start_codon:yes stop_codon:yes gene_type:complete
MKLNESFTDYLTHYNNENVHPELNSIKNKIYKCEQIPNLIVYGPPGVGKYTQTLSIISEYFNNDLKYEKKMCVQSQKEQYFIKMSSFHYEVDMSLLGCNAKILWTDIFSQIKDSIETSASKFGIVVCKNFHCINNELLDIFYSYIQNNGYIFNIRFILVSEHLSFIPTEIIESSTLIRVERIQKKNISSINKKYNTKNINNLKNVFIGIPQINKETIISNVLYDHLSSPKIDYLKLRDVIYDIFIFNISIEECILQLFKKIKDDSSADLSPTIIKIVSFLKYYNNNYRPITHVEQYFILLSKLL